MSRQTVLSTPQTHRISAESTQAAESAESDSDLENVDITESESDEEDPLADIL